MDFRDKRHFLSELAELDWDFSGHAVASGFARFHWHPARYPPQVPAILIAALSEKSDTVLDPFCGSGTTLVEALRLGRCSIGVDTNPVATLMSRAKVLSLNVAQFKSAKDRILAASAGILTSNSDRLGELAKQVPQAEEQSYWYAERTLAELSAIWKVLDEFDESAIREAAMACFSAMLVSVCSQNEHWGWVCDNVRPRRLVYHDAFSAFANKLDEYGSAASELAERRDPATTASVRAGRCADVLSSLQSSSVDLVVTSPPYFGVTDYAKSQRLSYLWFGFPLEESRKAETGARSKRRRRQARNEYLTELEASFAQVARVLKRGRYCVLVVGESSSREKYVADFEGVLNAQGLVTEQRIKRRLPRQRGIVASLTNEQIVVLRRE